MSKRRLRIHFSKTEDFEEINYKLKTVIRDAILKTLDNREFPYDAELSVTLCGNEYIKKLNNKYRGKDLHTDVLSFPMYEDGDFDIGECISGAVLGDIVISVERARAQAEEIGNSFLREVAFLAVHSTLHLLGYDHERSREEEEMQCALQREIIEKVNL